MAVTVKGLTVFLPVFPERGRGKSVIWMKGCHLPLTNIIGNNHLFHYVPAGVQLRLRIISNKSPESMSPAPFPNPHNESFCLYLLFHLASKSVVSLYAAVWRLWASLRRPEELTSLFGSWTARTWGKGRSWWKYSTSIRFHISRSEQLPWVQECKH